MTTETSIEWSRVISNYVIGWLMETNISMLPNTRRCSTPESSLLAAILQRAILDLQHNSIRGCSNPVEAARDWLESDSTREWSCWWVCSHLGIDHSYLLSCLRQRPDEIHQSLLRMNRKASSVESLAA